MIVTARKIAGWLLFAGLVAFTSGFVWAERTLYRAKTGIDEAGPALETIATRVRATFLARGTLCASSTLSSDDPFHMFHPEYASQRTRMAFEAEVAANAGFRCLGIDTHDLGSGQDMFSYESFGTHFVARAFRAHLYDPEGTLPRWEIRGEIVDGMLEVDGIERIPPGGPSFLGHPSSANALY